MSTPATIMTDHGELPVWVPFSERGPSEEDSNEYGDVEVTNGHRCWEVSHDHRAVNATHWRRIILPRAADAADDDSPTYDFGI